MVLSGTVTRTLLITCFFTNDEADDDDALEDGCVGHGYQNVFDNLFSKMTRPMTTTPKRMVLSSTVIRTLLIICDFTR